MFVDTTESEDDPLADSRNPSEDLIIAWMTAGGGDTPAGINNLVHNVVLHPAFNPSDLKDFNAVTAMRQFTRKHFKSGPALKAGDGWKEGSVSIRVPCTGVQQKESDAPLFVVDGILYRDIAEVITAELEDAEVFRNVHVTPYKEWWNPGFGDEPIRVYSESYNSDAMLQADAEMRNSPTLPHVPDGDLETFIISAILYSDSTHLASFGNASLWPIYLFPGNVSKYIRSKPTSLSAHHIAYIPTLPDTIKEFYQKHYKRDPSAEMLTHLGRELTHGVLRLILGGTVADAHKNPRRVRCGDNVLRRWLLRLLLHSADYKEKSILATIRSMGLFLCPRCLIKKCDVHRIGMDSDQKNRSRNLRDYTKDAVARIEDARRHIFDLGRSVGGKLEVLKEGSLIPTRNAYHTELRLNPATIMPVDILHDCELGFGKGVVMHNIRILHAVGGGAVNMFDTRFRQIPTFGRDTIRRFGGSVSALKKLAGRDFEDIIQCWMPVLEGLLPNSQHNKILLDLAFDLTTWHAYAKLRLHTTHTIRSLRTQSKELGRLLRRYANRLCPEYATKPLPGETAAAYRRKAKKAKKAGPTPQARGASNATSKTPKGSGFNLETYKIHALGDYADHIEKFGPTDCFSTYQGELEHRRVKRFYKRTNKIRFERQIAKHERMQRHYRKYVNSLRKKTGGRTTSQPCSAAHDASTNASPQQHYSMAERDRDHVDLYTLANQHTGDPALKDFVAKLKDHLLARIFNRQYNAEQPTFTRKDRSELYISEDRLDQRYTMKVYYTTYDLRRGKETVNMKSRSHIMTLSQDGEHPYAYAQVLGMFKLNVLHGPTMADEVRMDVLWVRWFEIDKSYRAGWKAKRLYRLKYVPPLDDGAFGFLDPDDIIRGSHIIPGFSLGHQTHSAVNPASVWDPKNDWEAYYINQFVDRDMFMRYRGGGVGHKYMRDIEDKYENMSRERSHGEQSHRAPGPYQANDEDNDHASDDDNEPGDSNQPSVSHGGRADESATGSDDGEGEDGLNGESDNEDYTASSSDNSSSGGDDSDEVLSDVDYDSYGLADP